MNFSESRNPDPSIDTDPPSQELTALDCTGNRTRRSGVRQAFSVMWIAAEKCAKWHSKPLRRLRGLILPPKKTVDFEWEDGISKRRRAAAWHFGGRFLNQCAIEPRMALSSIFATDTFYSTIKPPGVSVFPINAG